MLPRGGGGGVWGWRGQACGGFIPRSPARCVCAAGVTVSFLGGGGGGVLYLKLVRRTVPLSQPAPLSIQGLGRGMEAGQQMAKGDVSPPCGIHSVQKRGGGKEEEWSGVWMGGARRRGVGNRTGPQNDSSCPTERSPLGVEARDEPLSMLSEPELWCCCSEPALDVMVDEDVEEERVFSLKSVMITVTFPTVMANCWAVLRSMFFSLGLGAKRREI